MIERLRVIVTVALAVAASAAVYGQAKPSATATPAPPPAAPAGTGPFETQMLSYGAVDRITDAAATDVCRQPFDRFIIYDQNAFSSLLEYYGFLTDLDVLNRLYGKVTLHLAGVADFSSAVAALVAFLQSSTTETSATTPLSDDTVTASLLNALKTKCSDRPRLDGSREP